MRSIVVVNNPRDWDFDINGVEIVSAKSYLIENTFSEIRNVRVFNLCRSYRYQSTGYYVSLLAEARGHRPIPHITTIQDFKSQTIVRVISDEIDELIQKSFKKLKSNQFTLSVYFGQNVAKQYDYLSKQLYNLFQTPFIRATFIYNKKWSLQYINPISIKDIAENHKPYIVQFAKTFFSKKRFTSTKISRYLYDLAILVNESEIHPPSNKKAIQQFIEAAESLRINTELINKDDYNRIGEFDALFIRETTAVNHYTYKFSRRAYAEGMIVIDDPESILKCTNKVYLAELFAKYKISTPKTLIIHKDNKETIEQMLEVPCVLKKPDSYFSHGVVKVCDKDSLSRELESFLSSSDLVIAQQYTPTEFDWRIGILDRSPLYACKYFMANGHWQIYNWKDQKNNIGDVEIVPIKNVPDIVLDTAIKAANVVGDGLYGVDLKQINNSVFVIEVNDNPTIDYGIEDDVIKQKLYQKVMQSFLNRLEKYHLNK